ncbi:General substrate transporter [Metarhizium rileyi]|uniref:General substrate transporter n=1 Tax=Metarhizium rileyi (strain RCEF 4871) TaxID=1649241 RepID=A0A162J8J6_METRR|nr:General substrate transporter [Metarhizium rileyi RCEF 4871]
MDRHDSDKAPDGFIQYTERNAATNLTLWQSVKRYKNVVWCCLGLTTTILLYGYDYVIVGTTSAMPSFQKDFGRQLDGNWILPSLWLGLWTFASPGGSIIGAFCGGQIQDSVGRRASIAIGCFLSAVAVAICYVSYLPADMDARRGVFLAGKAFQGLAIGIVTTTTQTYMSEVLPPSLRGPILAFFPMFTLLGQLIGAAVIFGCMDMPNGYTICFASQWPFSFLPMVVTYFIPESPTYLVRKSRMAQALKSQEHLEAKDGDARITIDIVRRNIEHEQMLTKATYIDCFKRANLRRTLIVMFSGALPQVFGLAVLAKASYFAQVVGMSANISVVLLIVGIVCGLLANTVSIWVLHHVGRRRLVLLGLFGVAFLWLTMGISGIWDKQPTIIYTSVSMISTIVVAGLSVWPASYAVGAETSSLQLRGKTQGLGWLTAGASASIFGFCTPYLYNSDAANLKSKIGFIFAGLCALAGVVSYFHVPEMKGRTPAEIDEMFEAKLPAKDFKYWTASSSDSSQVLDKTKEDA